MVQRHYRRETDGFLTVKTMKHNEEYDMELMGGVLKGCLSAIAFWVVLILLLLCFASCKSVKYVPIIEHHTDTCYITKHQRDSIWMHDSIHVKEQVKGDTIFLWQEKWHTKYIEKQIHDTTYISKIDSIPQPYPVEVKVEKQLNWWQKFRMNVGVIAMIALLIWAVWQGAKFYMRRF